ncbi:MAG: hypothetical protein ABH843_01875 [Candidatus Omnitrophota bacterium]
MFIKILGYFWLTIGTLCLIWPQLLKSRLQKKGLRRMRKYFVIIAIILGSTLVSATWNLQGLLPKLIMIIGIIAIIKGIFLLKSKLAEKWIAWFAQKPLIYFRIGACCYIILGILILKLN